MLTKEECKEAVSILKDQHEYLSFNLRANYPFSIEMIREIQDCFEQLIKEHFNPQPYKFEDLKELIGKPIFDYKYKEFYILAEVKEEELYKDEGLEKFMICSDKKGLMRVFFEEGRFFPVTKAMEY